MRGSEGKGVRPIYTRPLLNVLPGERHVRGQSKHEINTDTEEWVIYIHGRVGDTHSEGEHKREHKRVGVYESQGGKPVPE